MTALFPDRGCVDENCENPPRNKTGGRLLSLSVSADGCLLIEGTNSPGRGTSSGRKRLILLPNTVVSLSPSMVLAVLLVLVDRSSGIVRSNAGLAGKASRAGSDWGCRVAPGLGGPLSGMARMGAPANGEEDFTLDVEVRDTREVTSRLVGEPRKE